MSVACSKYGDRK